MGDEPARLGPGGDRELLTRLFPFHIEIRFEPEPIISGVGASLQQWIGTPLVGRSFSECFAIQRPAIGTLDEASVSARSESVFVLAAAEHFGQLRGQVLPLGDGEAAFLGSPVLTTNTRVEELGLTMADFAPHDATVDLIVLQRFAEMQLDDLKEQAAKLSEAQQARDLMTESASTDPLTGLANRRGFWARCEAEIDDQRDLALLFIDVDRFKAVNDAHGHGTGDAVLRKIAGSLTGAVRSDDLVARLGGDEFAVLLPGADHQTAANVVERIRTTVARPFEVNGHMFASSVSIGVVFRTADETVDDLVQDADAAMYEGRARGPGRITWFAERMRAEREERRTLTDDLEGAVGAGRITTVFQPIVHLYDGSIIACEALARWTHPTLGPIAPDRFIELAERAGLIEPLDDLMLGCALSQLVGWQAQLPDFGVQVNFSGRSIGPSLATRIANALTETKRSPDSLTIEVTESWLIQNETEVAAALNEVADLGVRVHLDDFGTGYSSLAHVHALPITGLKIDRSFVGRATESERSRRLIAATIGMAKSLELEVIAEGVEDEATAELLTELGCDLAQGFFYAKPGTDQDISDMIDAGHRSSSDRA